MVAPIAISTGLDSNDTPLASPSVPRAATLRRVNSSRVASPPMASSVYYNSGGDLSPPLIASTSLRRVKSGVAYSSRHIAAPSMAGHHAPPIPSVPTASNLRRVKSGVATATSMRRDSTPMNYSTIASRAPPPLSLAPFALTAVRSFDQTAALLKSPFACGSEDFLQFPSSDELGIESPELRNAASLVMKDSEIDMNQSCDDARQTIGTIAHSSSTLSVSIATTECDYDTNPTELYLAVQNKQWDLVTQLAASYPIEASTWVSRKENDGKSLRWRLLPIHAAIVFQAPSTVIDALLNAFGLGAQCKDDQGKLPIHLCFRRDSDEEVISLILRAYPQGANATDDKGRTPMELANQCPQREAYIHLLKTFGTNAEANRGLSVKTSTELASPTVPSLQSSSTRPPRVPTATAARRKVLDSSTNKSGMDRELMEKLNRRREMSDAVTNSSDKDHNIMHEDASVSEEGMEIEYDVDKMLQATVVQDSHQDDELISADATLLQKFHSRRVKRDFTPNTQSLSRNDSKLSVNCDNNVSHERTEVEYDGRGSCNRSIVDMAPPSLRDQMRDRIERRNKCKFNQKVSSFQSLHNANTVSCNNENESSSQCSSVQSRRIDNKGSLKDFLHQRSGRDRDTRASRCEESITVASSICNSTTDESDNSSRYSLKKSETWESKLEATAEERDEATTVDVERHYELVASPSSVAVSKAPQALSPSLEITPKKNNARPTTLIESNELSSLPFTNDGDQPSRKLDVKARCVSYGYDDKQIEATTEEDISTFLSKNRASVAEEDVGDYGSKKNVIQHREMFPTHDGYGSFSSQIVEDGDQVRETAMAAPTKKGASRLSAKIHKDNIEKSKLNAWQMKSPEKELELYASTSLLTASTAEMTENPSGSYEDGSLSEVYTSRVCQAKSSDEAEVEAKSEEADVQIDPLEEDLSTPKLLMRLDKFRSKASFFISPVAADDDNNISDDELATPNLMKKADRFFSNSEEVIDDEYSTPATPVSRVDKLLQSASSVSSTTQSKFDRIMAKYESIDGREGDSYADESQDQWIPAPNLSPRQHSHIGFSEEAGNYTSRYSKRQESDDVQLSSALKGYDSNINTYEEENNVIKSISFRTALPRRPHAEQHEFFMSIPQSHSQESDAMSTLSRTTGYTTIGSVSISTENSAVIESYVQEVVHNILAHEVENAGSVKKELEAALKSKMKLAARVKKLMTKSDEQSLQLKKAHKAKKMERGKLEREMEIHLTRKASELKSCMEVALNQAEQSKRRALGLAQRDMEKEVSLLRSQLDTVEGNGIPIDRSLQSALQLVESNQRALREAAETDAKHALDMKQEIEQSFVSAVGEFETWSDKQLKILDARWERDAR